VIKYEIVKVLFTVQLQQEDESSIDNVKQEMQSMNDNVVLGQSTTPIRTKEKKIARNEPCPCGSGKKYKLCCGKSGPKRGVLAQK
jgi:preprotein translocase subunit SecA